MCSSLYSVPHFQHLLSAVMSVPIISDLITTLSRLDNILHYYEQYRLLLCAECQMSVQSTVLSSHIRSHLNDLRVIKDLHHSVISHYSCLPLNSSSNAHMMLQHTSPLPAFPELKLYHSAYQCTVNDCSQAFISKQSIRKHCSQVHETHYKKILKSHLHAQCLEKVRRYFIISADNLNA